MEEAAAVKHSFPSAAVDVSVASKRLAPTQCQPEARLRNCPLPQGHFQRLR